MKYELTGLLLAVAILSLVPSTLAVGQEEHLVAVLFDIGGRGDLSFNDMAAYGAEVAKSKLEQEGYTVHVTEFTPASSAEYETQLATFSESGRYDILCCIGFLWTDALNKTAPKYPDQHYMIIDAVVDQPNVMSIVFRENEGSALVGAAAAAVTSTGKVAVVLGMEIPILWKFEIGYAFGAKWMAKELGKDIEIAYVYTGTFGDPSKGREAATTFLDQGFDVIYAAAGATGLGVLDACYDRAVATGKPIFSIGVDADQDYIHPGYVLCSMRKKVDYGVELAVTKAVKGEFEPGILSLGLKEGGVGITTPEDMEIWADFLRNAGYSDEEINAIKTNVTEMYNTYLAQYQSKIDELKNKIINGEIEVPVPSPDTIQDLRSEYMGKFTFAPPTTTPAPTTTAPPTTTPAPTTPPPEEKPKTGLIVAVVVIIVIVIAAAALMMRKKE